MLKYLLRSLSRIRRSNRRRIKKFTRKKKEKITKVLKGGGESKKKI